MVENSLLGAHDFYLFISSPWQPIFKNNVYPSWKILKSMTTIASTVARRRNTPDTCYCESKPNHYQFQTLVFPGKKLPQNNGRYEPSEFHYKKALDYCRIS
jgi:hypothetical protein